MSFYIFNGDANCGKLATNRGMTELRKSAGPLLSSFLDDGIVQPEDVEDLVNECSRSESKAIRRIGSILKADGGPYIISDGVDESGDGPDGVSETDLHLGEEPTEADVQFAKRMLELDAAMEESES